MKTISLSEISNHDINVNNIVCFRQCWKFPHRSFSYISSPRPDNGFILITDGEAEYSQPDNKKITAVPGDILYLPEGSYYRVEFTKEPTNTMLINFMLSDSENIVLSETLTKITSDKKGNFAEIFSELCDIYMKSSGKLNIKSIFYALLNTLAAQNTVQDTVSSVMPAITYINNHLNSELKIPQLAHMCAMSESSFRREFIRFMGISPKKYINEEKIKKAKQMLLSSEFSINEICTVLGFYDNAHFSRLFKEVTGKTPIQYRNKN